MSLIEKLQNQALFDHPVKQFEVIETHISWVLLTGSYAYKIKKPVNFGFLDFSTLSKRKFYCEEELRLNRRLAPELYLAVIEIYDSIEQPSLKSNGSVIEYAVKMLQFPQSAQLDRLLLTQGLKPEYIDNLAQTIAKFHLAIDCVPSSSPYGDPEHVAQPVQENFIQIRNSIKDQKVTVLLDKLQSWSETKLKSLFEIFLQRKAEGYIRECHGDMHLRNMAWLNNEVVIFDCIEFNKNFYLIDVISEIAFLIMDLEDRKQEPLAWRCLNRYLELTGDYVGIQLLPFYKVYRAMVRAKVDALRSCQEPVGSGEYIETMQDCMQYLQLAESYIQGNAPCLIINHGLSGSGKTWYTHKLIEKIPAISIRSDVERKRLFLDESHSHQIANVEQGIYSTQATERTYRHLASLAKKILLSGYSVIIDAANLKQKQRQLFIDLADSIDHQYCILNYHASPETLRKRVQHRLQHESDASDATLSVLEYQLDNYAPIETSQGDCIIEINTEDSVDIDQIADQLHTRGCPIIDRY